MTDDDILDFVRIEQWRDKFWSKVTKTDACWLYCWNGTNCNTYGHFEGMAAHRWMWIHLLKRPAPKGMELHHECETPRCVRPDHLSLLTPSEHRRLHVKRVTITVDGITSSIKDTAQRIGMHEVTLRGWIDADYSPQLICDRFRHLRSIGAPKSQTLFPEWREESEEQMRSLLKRLPEIKAALL
jgi:hypothetical protein